MAKNRHLIRYRHIRYQIQTIAQRAQPPSESFTVQISVSCRQLQRQSVLIPSKCQRRGLFQAYRLRSCGQHGWPPRPVGHAPGSLPKRIAAATLRVHRHGFHRARRDGSKPPGRGTDARRDPFRSPAHVPERTAPVLRDGQPGRATQCPTTCRLHGAAGGRSKFPRFRHARTADPSICRVPRHDARIANAGGQNRGRMRSRDPSSVPIWRDSCRAVLRGCHRSRTPLRAA